MPSFFSLPFEQTQTLFRELSQSPLIFPLLVIFLWRGSNRTLAPTIFPTIAVLALFFFEPAIRSGGPRLSWLAPTNIEYLDPHMWLSSMLRDQQTLIDFVEKHDPGWHLDNFMVSGRTASYAFCTFSTLLLHPNSGTFRGCLEFIGLMVAVGFLTIVLIFVYMMGVAPIVQNADLATEEKLARKVQVALEYLARVPELAAASAMLFCWFIARVVSYLRSTTVGFSFGILLNVVYPCLMLGAGILGFGLLSFWQGLLFLLFMIVGYPICLAFTRSDAADATLVKRYSLGIEQLFGIFRYKGGYI
jgi:hypothetical protein